MVTLPPSELIDQAHIKTICTRVQLAANECPAGSVYGHAKAESPLLDEPLSGPVYLVSSNHVLPDLLADLQGQVDIRLHGVVKSVKGHRIQHHLLADPRRPGQHLHPDHAGRQEGPDPELAQPLRTQVLLEAQLPRPERQDASRRSACHSASPPANTGPRRRRSPSRRRSTITNIRGGFSIRDSWVRARQDEEDCTELCRRCRRDRRWSRCCSPPSARARPRRLRSKNGRPGPAHRHDPGVPVTECTYESPAASDVHAGRRPSELRRHRLHRRRHQRRKPGQTGPRRTAQRAERQSAGGAAVLGRRLPGGRAAPPPAKSAPATSPRKSKCSSPKSRSARWPSRSTTSPRTTANRRSSASTSNSKCSGSRRSASSSTWKRRSNGRATTTSRSRSTTSPRSRRCSATASSSTAAPATVRSSPCRAPATATRPPT